MTIATNALVIMTKAPEPGQSKTRLVPALSYAEAAELSRALLLDQLDNLSRLSCAQLFIAFTPPEASDFFQRFTADGFTCFPQQGESLGARMRHAFEYLFNLGAHKIVLIGSDLPVITSKIFEQAYLALEQRQIDVVLGPSVDGGYYLVGMNRLIPEMFDGITWSCHDVLERTREKLHTLGKNYKLLSSCYDIDTIEDLARLRVHCDSNPNEMRNTSALLNQLRRRGTL